MMIQVISARAQCPAIFARIEQAAREMNILHVFPEIPTAVFHHAAQQTPETRSTVRASLNIGVQIFFTI
jgi:hypothetical protein